MTTVLEKRAPHNVAIVETLEKKMTKRDLKKHEDWAINQFQTVHSELEKNRSGIKALSREYDMLHENFQGQRKVNLLQDTRIKRLVRWVAILIFCNLMGLAFSIGMVCLYLFG